MATVSNSTGSDIRLVSVGTAEPEEKLPLVIPADKSTPLHFSNFPVLNPSIDEAPPHTAAPIAAPGPAPTPPMAAPSFAPTAAPPLLPQHQR